MSFLSWELLFLMFAPKNLPDMADPWRICLKSPPVFGSVRCWKQVIRSEITKLAQTRIAGQNAIQRLDLLLYNRSKTRITFIMQNPAAKGFIVLSTPRSGTNWLGSLSNATGIMGKYDESLSTNKLKKPARRYDPEAFYQHVMQVSSSPNGRFSLKIFPWHLKQAMHIYQLDFIARCRQENDVALILIKRQDRLAQAISFIQARQTGKWTSQSKRNIRTRRPEPRYHFGSIAQAYFYLGRANAFWDSYLGLLGLPYKTFTYEALAEDPSPYLAHISQHLEVPNTDNFQSNLKIQRNKTSLDWRARFLDELKTNGLHPSVFGFTQPKPGIGNTLRMAASRPLVMPYRDLQS